MQNINHFAGITEIYSGDSAETFQDTRSYRKILLSIQDKLKSKTWNELIVNKRGIAIKWFLFPSKIWMHE